MVRNGLNELWKKQTKKPTQKTPQNKQKMSFPLNLLKDFFPCPLALNVAVHFILIQGRKK